MCQVYVTYSIVYIYACVSLHYFISDTDPRDIYITCYH